MHKFKEMYLKYKEIINYLIFGVLTTVVSLATKYLLLFTILERWNWSFTLAWDEAGPELHCHLVGSVYLWFILLTRMWPSMNFIWNLIKSSVPRPKRLGISFQLFVVVSAKHLSCVSHVDSIFNTNFEKDYLYFEIAPFSDSVNFIP